MLTLAVCMYTGMPYFLNKTKHKLTYKSHYICYCYHLKKNEKKRKNEKIVSDFASGLVLNSHQWGFMLMRDDEVLTQSPVASLYLISTHNSF